MSYIISLFQCIMELIKNSLHTLVDDFINILQDVCILLMKIYECQQHSSILDIIKQVCVLYVCSILFLFTPHPTYIYI